MTDSELDQLLHSWEAPTPSPSLRENLRRRFPRREPRRLAHPLRWALATGVACTLALGMAQSGGQSWEFSFIGFHRWVHEEVSAFLDGIAIWKASWTVREIRQSNPKVYVDGQIAAPLHDGPAATLEVELPGDELYRISLYPGIRLRDADGRPTGWVQAGRVHGSAVEFRAGDKDVRIECDRPIADSDLPVFVTRHSP